MTTRQLALGTALILSAGCAGNQVTTDFSPATRFSQFRTFALVMPPNTAGEQLVDQRVRNAVEAQLDAKGLTASDRQHADLFAGYGVVDKTHTEIYSGPDGWGWGGNWGWRYYRWGVAWPMSSRRQIETYTDGTVIVNLIDARTKQVVWHGEVADVVNLPVSDPLRATRQIDDAVAKLFAKYPPQLPRA
jgi:hypothetical protein